MAKNSVPNDQNVPDDQNWNVRATSPFRRSLNKLPPKVAGAVLNFVEFTLPTNPYRLSGELEDELADKRSCRRGNYRILIRLDDETRTVYLYDVDYRADMYRPR